MFGGEGSGLSLAKDVVFDEWLRDAGGGCAVS